MATRLASARPARAYRPDAAPAPGPVAPERRHLRVVPPDYVTTRARQKRARRLVVLGGIAIAAALFGVVAFHVVLTQNQLDLQHLQARGDAASVKQQQLRLQVAQLESPGRVVDAAQKLGMVPPATVHYLSPNGAAPPPPKPTPTPTTLPAHAAAPKTYKAPATTVPAAKTAVAKPAASTPQLTTAKRSPVTTTPARPTR